MNDIVLSVVALLCCAVQLDKCARAVFVQVVYAMLDAMYECSFELNDIETCQMLATCTIVSSVLSLRRQCVCKMRRKSIGTVMFQLCIADVELVQSISESVRQ